MFKAKTESGLRGLADITRAELDRAITRGINNAAFELRRRTPDIVKGQIDRMSPKLRVLQQTTVTKATPGRAEAFMTIGGRQGEILSRHEFTWTAPRVLQPLTTRIEDRYGNIIGRIKERATRDDMTITDGRKRRKKGTPKKKTGRPHRDEDPRAKPTKPTRRVGRFFIVSRGDASARARGLRPGLYERIERNNRIELVATSRLNARYRPVFKIRDGYTEHAQAAMIRYIQESIDFRRANRK